ncbi:MAG: hypothetical protein IH598_03005 [Bacteroidales bacterium]|nr:hypothetical protein [Bacteroidales bacterium]
MNLQNTEHIKDDFLKNLLNNIDDDKPSEGFTDKVMAAIPVIKVEKETVEKLPFNWWQWTLIAAAFVGVGYMIFSFDVFGRFSHTDVQPGISLMNYVNMFSSIVSMFTNGFANIKFSSMPLMIILASIVLFLGDKLLRKKINTHVVML